MSTSKSSATAPPVTVLLTTSFSRLPLARPMTIELMRSSPSVSDEQVDVGLVGLAQVGAHTGVLEAVHELLFAQSHDVHRHGAGDHLDALLLGARDQLVEGHDVVVLHDLLHHGRAHRS